MCNWPLSVTNVRDGVTRPFSAQLSNRTVEIRWNSSRPPNNHLPNLKKNIYAFPSIHFQYPTTTATTTTTTATATTATTATGNSITFQSLNYQWETDAWSSDSSRELDSDDRWRLLATGTRQLAIFKLQQRQLEILLHFNRWIVGDRLIHRGNWMETTGGAS